MPEPKNPTLRKWNQAIRSQMSPLRLAPARESEIAEELSNYAKDRFRELLASGLTEAEAHRLVLDELNAPDLLAAELSSVERTNFPEQVSLGSRDKSQYFAGLGHDIRYAYRALRRNQKFSLFAILMLAFGIGATTAIFSIVEGVLLRPLPFSNPEQLVALGDHVGGTNWGEGGNDAPVTAPEIPTYIRETRSFRSLGGIQGASFELSELSAGGVPAQINATRLTTGIS
jgi:hypothetical protein